MLTYFLMLTFSTFTYSLSTAIQTMNSNVIPMISNSLAKQNIRRIRLKSLIILQ